MFHVTDWYPTLLTLAGADLEELRGRGVDGVNQWEAVGSRGRTCPSLCSQLPRVRHAQQKCLISWAILNAGDVVVHDVTMSREDSGQQVASAVVLKGRHKLIWGITGRQEMNSW